MKKKKLVTSLAATSIIMSSMVSNVFANSDILTDNVPANTISTDDIVTTTLEDGTMLATTVGGMNLINSSRLSIKYSGPTIHIPVKVNGELKQHCTVMTVKSPNSNDTFKVTINYNGDKKDVFNDFIVAAKIVGNRVNFKVFTIDGASLGELTRSQNILDRKIECSYLGHTIIESDFHYTFFNYGERIINVNLNPVAKDAVVTENKADSQDPVVAQDQTTNQDSALVENQADVQDTVVTEEQVTNQDSIVAENEVVSQDSVVTEDKTTNQDSTVVEDQADVQDTVVTENKLDVQENIVLE